MKKNTKPTASKLSVLRQLCNLIPLHLVPKLGRETGVRFNHPKTERLLAASHPKHPIAIEHTQVDEINVSAIKDNDLARVDSGADFRGANTVGRLCRFDQDKARQ